MSFSIHLKQSWQKNLRRIAHDQLDNATTEAGNTELSHSLRIHQARNRCKKLRALLRVFRPGFPDTYQKENAAFRDAAKKLSRVRDADALRECYDKLMDEFRDEVDLTEMAPIPRKLTLRRNALVEESADMDAQLEDFAESLRSAAGRVGEWTIEEPRKSVLKGVKKTYLRGRKAMQKAKKDPTDEQLHEWRKRVKYIRFQCKILSTSWPLVLHPLRRQYKLLSDLLGDDHNLAVLRQTLLDDDEQFHDNSRRQVLIGLLDRRRAVLQKESFDLGEQLYVLKPKAFKKWINALITA